MCCSVTVSLKDLGLTSSGNFTVYEVFDNRKMGMFSTGSKISVPVNPTGVFFGKAIPS